MLLLMQTVYLLHLMTRVFILLSERELIQTQTLQLLRCRYQNFQQIH